MLKFISKLIFQIDHDNRMKSYNNYMKNKENEIEGRTDNYINYIRNKNNNVLFVDNSTNHFSNSFFD